MFRRASLCHCVLAVFTNQKSKSLIFMSHEIELYSIINVVVLSRILYLLISITMPPIFLYALKIYFFVVVSLYNYYVAEHLSL